MAKPQFALKIAAALLAVCAAVWMVRHFSEPSYQGKLLSAWLDDGVRNGDMMWFGGESRGCDSQPAQAVLAVGPCGIPLLLSLLRGKDTALQKKLRDLAQKYKWIPIDRHNPDDLHAMACYGFWVLGPAGKSAVPQLIILLDDDDAGVRTLAAYVLSFIGPADTAALPALEKRLIALSQTISPGGDWQGEAHGVLRAMGEMGPRARSALPQISLLSQPPSGAIAWARAARIKISGEGLDSAIGPLKNPSAIADWRLARAVATDLGTNAAPAVALLVANLQSTNEEVQSSALFALAGIHAHPDLCLPAITDFLSSSNHLPRLPALLAICAFGRAATQWVSISQITPCLTDDDGLRRQAATNALRRLYPEAAAKLSVK
ncbi:MAG TPA: hypothetical protein VGR14_07455 [Verrucomicrobiae bacterium]|jgi:HEAT repeat protein|nr:hypothetical protein [Verrucomicrobiae bacterium]